MDEVHGSIKDEEEGTLHEQTVAISCEEVFLFGVFCFLLEEETGGDVCEVEPGIKYEYVLKCLMSRYGVVKGEGVGACVQKSVDGETEVYGVPKGIKLIEVFGFPLQSEIECGTRDNVRQSPPPENEHSRPVDVAFCFLKFLERGDGILCQSDYGEKY